MTPSAAALSEVLTVGAVRGVRCSAPSAAARDHDGKSAAWLLEAGLATAVLAVLAAQLGRRALAARERRQQQQRLAQRLWHLATQGAEAAGAVAADLGQPDAQGVYTHESLTGALFFRQRCATSWLGRVGSGGSDAGSSDWGSCAGDDWSCSSSWRSSSGSGGGSCNSGSSGGGDAWSRNECSSSAGSFVWEWSVDRRVWQPTSVVDSSLRAGDGAGLSAAGVVLIRRLELESQLLRHRGSGGGGARACGAAAQLPPLDLAHAARDISCLADVPAAFLCPLSCSLMVDPVVTPSGATFDRSALLQWIRQAHTDPVSGAALNSDELTPNLVLRDLIHAWLHTPAAAPGGRQDGAHAKAARQGRGGGEAAADVPGCARDV